MSALEALGWLGNALFFSRWIVQWFASERAKKSVAPASFWALSLAGTASLGTYTLIRDEPILLAGYVVNIAIYSRNLLLSASGARALRGSALAVVTVVLVGLLAVAVPANDWNVTTPSWVAVGIAGFVVWNGRWPLQWWFSERQGRSHFPPVFWWLSLLGTSLQLAYSLHLQDPIFIAGYIPGPIIQVRNLMLNRRAARAEAAPPVAAPSR